MYRSAFLGQSGATSRRGALLAFAFRVILLPALLAAFFTQGCARDEPHASAASSASVQLPAVEYLGQWGSRGDGPGQLQDPVGPAVDNAGRVYFADRGSGSVAKFEAGGVPLLAFDDPSARDAAAIAVDRGGGIYVADLAAGRLQIFWPEGDRLSSIRLVAQRGFAGPFALDVDSQGRILLPDPPAGEIVVLDRHGRIEGTWKMPADAAGRAAHPSLVAAAPNGTIFVADANSGQIAKFAPNGQFLPTLAAADSPGGPALSIAASSKYLFVLRAPPPGAAAPALEPRAGARLEIWTLDGELKLKDNLGGRLDDSAGNSPSRSAGAAAGKESGIAGLEKRLPRRAVPVSFEPPPARASLAVTPQGELLVLDPAGPRVLRFRVHLDSQ